MSAQNKNGRRRGRPVGGSLSSDRVLQAAVPLFAERGFSGVSMRDLSSACGVTPAALYHHFPDKETLYVRAAQAALEPKMATLEEMIEQTREPAELLRRFVRWFVNLVAADPTFMRFLTRELLDGDEARIARISRQVLAPAVSHMTAATGKVPGVDPVLVGFSVLSLVLGHFIMAPVRQQVDPAGYDAADTDAIAEHISRLLIQGVTT